MDKQLVNDLRTVIQAKRKANESISQNQTDDVKRFMDPEIVRNKENAGFPIGAVPPTKPQKSMPPQGPTPPQKPTEPDKKPMPSRERLRDMDWSYPRVYPAIPIVSVIMILMGFFMLLQGPWGWILVGISAATLLFPYIKKVMKEFTYAKRSFEKAKKEAIQYNESKCKLYEAELKEYNEAMQKYHAELQKAEEARAEWQKAADAHYAQAMKAYEAAMEKYRKEEAEYDEACKRFSAICDAYQKEEEKATKLMQEFNDGVRRKAEKEFEDTLASLTTYIPVQYADEAETLLQYVLDARADTLKEAIELSIKEKREWARDLQRAAEADQAAEQAEELIRIQKGMRQCSQCRNRATCYQTATNDGECSYFSKGKQYI